MKHQKVGGKEVKLKKVFTYSSSLFFPPFNHIQKFSMLIFLHLSHTLLLHADSTRGFSLIFIVARLSHSFAAFLSSSIYDDDARMGTSVWKCFHDLVNSTPPKDTIKPKLPKK